MAKPFEPVADASWHRRSLEISLQHHVDEEVDRTGDFATLRSVYHAVVIARGAFQFTDVPNSDSFLLRRAARRRCHFSATANTDQHTGSRTRSALFSGVLCQRTYSCQCLNYDGACFAPPQQLCSQPLSPHWSGSCQHCAQSSSGGFIAHGMASHCLSPSPRRPGCARSHLGGRHLGRNRRRKRPLLAILVMRQAPI